MKEIFRKLQQEAVQIANQYPSPDFYRDFTEEVGRSRRFFDADPAVGRLHTQVAGAIENDFGHGLDHAREVALDAGALILVEARNLNYPDMVLNHQLRLAHFAGLLHDIRRKEKKHAEAGAEAAENILKDYPMAEADVIDICTAIRNHEAFGENRTGSDAGRLLSDSLYDADKFRWGPENFTRTIWGMISFMDISVDVFMYHYPRGMAFLEKIRSTFRTRTGKAYGPQFIDLGLSIGNALYERIRTRYMDVAGLS